MTERHLPYFDQIISGMAEGVGSSLKAFERHVHWGYYATPAEADTSAAGYVEAAEAMTGQVCRAAGVGDGQRVLDVGCGFGGTVDHINQRTTACRLVGLNIDGRQLQQARRRVAARPGNRVVFVEADATALPFADRSFDVVLAVECVFHFPSRKRFLREASRLLRPGGRLALTDFVTGAPGLAALVAWQDRHPTTPSRFYGANHRPLTSEGYRKAARGAGLDVTLDRDLTAHTVPTYPAMRSIYEDAGLQEGVRATDELAEVTRQGLLDYRLLAFAPTGGRTSPP